MFSGCFRTGCYGVAPYISLITQRLVVQIHPRNQLQAPIRCPFGTNNTPTRLAGLYAPNYHTVHQPLEKPQRLTNWSGFCMDSPSGTAHGKRLAFRRTSLQSSMYVGDLERTEVSSRRLPSCRRRKARKYRPHGRRTVSRLFSSPIATANDNCFARPSLAKQSN